MTEFILGLFLGAGLGFFTAAFLVAGSRADEHAEIDRLRRALEYAGRASTDAHLRRAIAKVLDPDGSEAGA